jgi:hypothetical protein
VSPARRTLELAALLLLLALAACSRGHVVVSARRRRADGGRRVPRAADPGPDRGGPVRGPRTAGCWCWAASRTRRPSRRRRCWPGQVPQPATRRRFDDKPPSRGDPADERSAGRAEPGAGRAARRAGRGAQPSPATRARAPSRGGGRGRARGRRRSWTRRSTAGPRRPTRGRRTPEPPGGDGETYSVANDAELTSAMDRAAAGRRDRAGGRGLRDDEADGRGVTFRGAPPLGAVFTKTVTVAGEADGGRAGVRQRAEAAGRGRSLATGCTVGAKSRRRHGLPRAGGGRRRGRVVRRRRVRAPRRAAHRRGQRVPGQPRARAAAGRGVATRTRWRR